MQKPNKTYTSHTNFTYRMLAIPILLLTALPVSGQTEPNWVFAFPGLGAMFTDAAFTPDSKQLLLTDHGYQGCGVYDFGNHGFVVSYDNSGAKYQSLAISPDGTKLAFGCGGYCFASVGLGEFPSRTRIWQERYARNVTASSLPSPVWSMAFSPDATRLYVVAGLSMGHLVDTGDGHAINDISMKPATHCEFFSDGRRVFVLSRDFYDIGWATIYDTETGEELWSVEGPKSGGITGDGKRVVLHYSNEGVVRIFDLEKGGEPEVYDCADPIMQVLSDGKNVVTANGRLGGLRQLNFDASKGRGTCAQVRAFNLPAKEDSDYSEEDRKIRQARFSPDGKKLMFLTRPAVYVWDTSDLPSAVQETAKYKN